MDEAEPSVAAKLQVVLRPEQIEDCRAVAAAHIATWQAGYAGILPAELLASHDLDKRTQRRRERFAENNGDSTVIADLDGSIIGHVSYGPYRAKPEQVDVALGDPAPRDLVTHERAVTDERAPVMPALGESALGEPVAGVPVSGIPAMGDLELGDLVPVPPAPSAATSGNPVLGDNARGDTARGDTARGDTARGDTARGDTARGDTARGDTARGDTARGDAARGDAEPGVPAASDAARGNPEIGESEVGEPQADGAQVDGAQVGEIGALYVHPDHWGEGVGTRLLSAALEGLPQRVIRLWVLEHNHRARRFFAQQGFKPDGARSLFRPDGVGEGYPEIRYTMHRG